LGTITSLSPSHSQGRFFAKVFLGALSPVSTHQWQSRFLTLACPTVSTEPALCEATFGTITSLSPSVGQGRFFGKKSFGFGVWASDLRGRARERQRWHHLAVRRERVVAVIIVVTCNGVARADDEDVVIDLAASDLGCREFNMTHEANHYYVAGCGKRRTYECVRGRCVDISEQPVANVDGACVAGNVVAAAAGGCAACFGGAASLPPDRVPRDCAQATGPHITFSASATPSSHP
jgi:hypothetical protein